LSRQRQLRPSHDPSCPAPAAGAPRIAEFSMKRSETLIQKIRNVAIQSAVAPVTPSRFPPQPAPFIRTEVALRVFGKGGTTLASSSAQFENAFELNGDECFRTSSGLSSRYRKPPRSLPTSK
jgi:hypothetical protein